jgi:malate dehydrogenase (oxaloacetate-decarboxylating)
MDASREAREASALVPASVAEQIGLRCGRRGLAQVELSNPINQVHEAMWEPVYPA